MGVEYRLFIVVNDANWKPNEKTFNRIEQVLKKYNLIENIEEIVDLSNGQVTPTNNTQIANDTAGKAIRYHGVCGSHVKNIVGESYYDDTDDDTRYTQSITVILGNDYRIPWSLDLDFQCVQLPTLNKIEINKYEDEETYWTSYYESYKWAEGTVPPIIGFKVEPQKKPKPLSFWQTLFPKYFKKPNEQPVQVKQHPVFLGYWKGAVIIDLGKDLPAFADESYATLPNQTFVAEIKEALQAKDVFEFGGVY